MDAEERAHKRTWDLHTFGPASVRRAPEGVISTPFEAAWIALERERVSVLGSLGELRDEAEEARLAHLQAKAAADQKREAVRRATDTLRRLVEQQASMAAAD